MTAQESKTHNFWPSRIAAAIALIVVLGSMGYAQNNAQQNARQDLEKRFAIRGTAASSFLDSYIRYTLNREQELAKLRLGDPKVTHDQFLDYLDDFGFGPSVLLDSTGHVLDIAPYDEKLIGTQLTTQYEHLREAVNGAQTVSNVVPSATLRFPIVAFATPFESQVGTRVISGAYDLTTQPLGNYLKNAVPFIDSYVYLVDDSHKVIASSNEKSGTLKSVDAALEKASSDATSGSYVGTNGVSTYFASHTIEGTPWKIVLTVPKETLYKPVNGMTRVLPWVFLTCFALVAMWLTWIIVREHERRLRLQDVALIDLLTGIYNPRGVKGHLARLISASRRHDYELSISIIDIDDFRVFNETYGQNVGDEILQRVAEQIQSRLRAEDIVGRWGGEEFVAILPDTGSAGAHIVAERIRRGVEEEVRSLVEPDAQVTISVGIASFQKDDTVETIVSRADTELESAKSSGKNQVRSPKKS